jgi:hypothetical protein
MLHPVRPLILVAGRSMSLELPSNGRSGGRTTRCRLGIYLSIIGSGADEGSECPFYRGLMINAGQVDRIDWNRSADTALLIGVTLAEHRSESGCL